MKKTKDNERRLSSLIEQVQPLLQQNHTKKALTKLKKILSISPNHLDALVWSAEILRDIGNTEQSEKFFDKAIALDGRFLRAIHGRALLRYRLRRLPDALCDFNRLIQLRPSIPESYNNRGNVFLMIGDFKKAHADFSSALALNPKLASALNSRGFVNHKLGSFQLALEDLNASIRAKHDFPMAFFNRGNILKDISRFDEAMADYEQALHLAPNFAPAYNNRGTIKRILGDYNQALEDFNLAIRLDTKFQGAYYNRGNIFKELRQFDQAAKDLSIAIALNPNDANAYNARGNVFKELYMPEKAINDFGQAIALQPNLADAYNNRGIVYSEARCSKEALCDFEKAISISPHLGATHRQISILKKYSKSDPHIKQMQALLAGGKMSTDDMCHLLYALAKSSDDLGEIRQAFDYYSRGGKLKKQLLKYNASQDIDYFNFIKAKIERFLECPVKKVDDRAIKPIFIIGMPRSGTSLIEQIISSHSEVFGAGELPFWGFYTSQLYRGELKYNLRTVKELRKRYFCQITKIAGTKSFVTDKMPNNFLSLGLIKSAFPEAKLIHTRREAAAVCWSNFVNYFAGNSLGHSYTLEDTVKYYLQYETLMNQWKNYLKSEIYEVDYENLTNDPEPEIRRLIEHIELPWENACLSPQKNLRAVRTASMGQIGKSIYQNSSSSWKKYSKLIGNKFDQLPKFHQDTHNG